MWHLQAILIACGCLFIWNKSTHNHGFNFVEFMVEGATYVYEDMYTIQAQPKLRLGFFVFVYCIKVEPSIVCDPKGCGLGVFIATPPDGLCVTLQDNSGVRYAAAPCIKDDYWQSIPTLPTNFADHIHWPVSRGFSTTVLTDTSLYADRPTHTFLGMAGRGGGQRGGDMVLAERNRP